MLATWVKTLYKEVSVGGILIAKLKKILPETLVSRNLWKPGGGRNRRKQRGKNRKGGKNSNASRLWAPDTSLPGLDWGTKSITGTRNITMQANTWEGRQYTGPTVWKRKISLINGLKEKNLEFGAQASKTSLVTVLLVENSDSTVMCEGNSRFHGAKRPTRITSLQFGMFSAFCDLASVVYIVFRWLQSWKEKENRGKWLFSFSGTFGEEN